METAKHNGFLICNNDMFYLGVIKKDMIRKEINEMKSNSYNNLMAQNKKKFDNCQSRPTGVGLVSHNFCTTDTYHSNFS